MELFVFYSLIIIFKSFGVLGGIFVIILILSVLAKLFKDDDQENKK